MRQRHSAEEYKTTCGTRARRGVPFLALAALAVPLFWACASPVPSVPPPTPVPEEVAPAAAPIPPPPPCLRIVQVEVFKQTRTLVADCERGAQVTMTVALGRRPEGTKQEAGDLRTPEGTYHIWGEREPSRFHGFVPFDYPSEADAQRAFSERRISQSELDRILASHSTGAPIPADTALGGRIGLHGEGERWRGDSADLDWTYGCLAISDDEFDFVVERIERGVPVIVHP